jgi:chitinase
MKFDLASVILGLNLVSLPSFVYAQKNVVGYYVPWGKVEPEQVEWKKLTHVNYGFGVLYKKNDPTSIFVDRYYDGTRIRKVQKLAKANGVKSLISLGGWTGGQTFSTIAKDPALRKKFINNALLFVRKNTKPDWDENPDGYDLDGIDIDWEYPAREAAKCNVVDPNDTANYLVLLKELREAMDKEFPNERKLLTAAVRVQPFDGPNKKPLANVSEFAKYFDFINIMIYDIMGGWSATTGPNAPFDYETSKGGDPFGYRQAIDDWLKAGFPADKLVAGLAFYGRSTTATVDMNATPGNQYAAKSSVVPKGDPSDANDVNFFCNEGSVYSGVWKWKYIRSEILKSDYKTPAAPWTRRWDNVTRTPWLFNSQTKQFISYDDPESLKIKVDHAKAKNLKGLMYWDISHDVTGELLNVIQGIRN